MARSTPNTAVKVFRATPQDRRVWNDFVSHLPAASYCHLFDWFTILSRAYGKTCYYLYSSQGESWTGVLPVVHMKGPLSGNRLVSLPFLDQGGILAACDGAAVALRDAAFGLANEVGAAGLDLRGSEGLDGRDSPETRRYRFLLRFEGSEERLWEGIGPKVRNQIRKSEKSGLVTHKTDAKGLESFYTIFGRNMRDLGSPAHSFRFFREILSSFGAAASVFVVSRGDGQQVAGAISIRFGDTVSVPWASSLRSARPDCPNHALYWGILRDALEAGVAEFDFGRSSVGTGTFHFKKQWRARAEPLIWRSYDGRKKLERETAWNPDRHAFLVNLWRRIPVPLANRVGPWLRRQIPN